MLEFDRQSVKHVEDLLNHLLRWERAIRVRLEPAFKDRAAGEVQEPGLDALAFEVGAQLGQEVEAIHGRSCSFVADHSLDSLVIFVDCMIHVNE